MNKYGLKVEVWEGKPIYTVVFDEGDSAMSVETLIHFIETGVLEPHFQDVYSPLDTHDLSTAIAERAFV